MMLTSFLLLVVAVLSIYLAEVSAYTWSMNCPSPNNDNPDVGNSQYSCCNSFLDIQYCNPYNSNSHLCAGFSWSSSFIGDVDKYSIGGGKTHTYHVNCGDNIICGAKWGHSGGNIDCIMADGAFGLTDFITYSCHNSAPSAGGHVWMESVICHTRLGSTGCGPCQMSR
jgi:hypothetical protein